MKKPFHYLKIEYIFLFQGVSNQPPSAQSTIWTSTPIPCRCHPRSTANRTLQQPATTFVSSNWNDRNHCKPNQHGRNHRNWNQHELCGSHCHKQSLKLNFINQTISWKIFFRNQNLRSVTVIYYLVFPYLLVSHFLCL